MESMGEFERELGALLPRLRRFTHALSHNAADADDLAGQAVERAIRARDQWTPGTRLDSWVYRIARNLWIDETRARSRRSRVERPPEEGELAGHDPRAANDAAIDLGRAMAALARLPDEQREVVALILIDGMGYRETAELLGLPIGTVSSRLVRGRTALLASLGEH
jgi:RNA polymerase sigma-70 factor (ECF subfamily)